MSDRSNPLGTPTTAPKSWVEVLVDCPGTTESYLYGIPHEFSVEPGDIVSVPFGSQQMGGLAIRTLAVLPPGLKPDQIRFVEDVVGRGFFPASYWAVLQQVADYYCTSLIQVVRTALPPGLLRRSQRRIRLTPAFDPADPRISLATPHAQAILAALHKSATGNYTWKHLQRQVQRARQGVRELIALGWVESYLEPPKPVQPKQQQAVTLTEPGHTDLSGRQQEVVDVLRRQGGEMWVQAVLQQCRTSSSVVRALEQKGWVVVQNREVLRQEVAGGIPGDVPQALTVAQAMAVGAIAQLQGFCRVVLHGVTGSGKTEVYLQAIAPILQRGQSALVLVPEIGLTPQLTDRFQARFGANVRVYHSALSEGERYDTWRQMLTAQPQVIIGTRSAIFAPLHHLGMIILDEEHDGSFKQDQPAPCYHTRQVAQWRAQAAQCPLILGSATPAIETWQCATQAAPSADPPIDGSPVGLPSADLRRTDRDKADLHSIESVDPSLPAVHPSIDSADSAEIALAESINNSAASNSADLAEPSTDLAKDLGNLPGDLADLGDPATRLTHPGNESVDGLVLNQTGIDLGHLSAEVRGDRPLSDPWQSPIPTLYLSLPERIHARPLPPIQIVDMRQEFRQGHRSIFSRSLQDALLALQDQQGLKEKRQQGVLFIHRRGHSTFVSCRSCGHVINCPHCDISLTYHQPHAQHAATLRCHYCGYGRAYPAACPECQSPYLKQFGSGTQRVVEELTRQFPGLTCIRFDSDTTRTKGSHRALLTRFAQGDADLLVGTQMLAKGIDLPQVTLVGIVAADGLLHLADYRAGERAFQTLLQVAGRAGRGSEPGRVILQTYSPLHPVVEAVQRQDYAAFAQQELSEREALRYPPFSQLILLRMSGPQEAEVEAAALKLAQVLGAIAPQWEQLGPVPAVVARVARLFRWQIMLRGTLDENPGAIAWEEVRSHCPRNINLTVDVDPLNFW